MSTPKMIPVEIIKSMSSISSLDSYLQWVSFGGWPVFAEDALPDSFYYLAFRLYRFRPVSAYKDEIVPDLRLQFLHGLHSHHKAKLPILIRYKSGRNHLKNLENGCET